MHGFKYSKPFLFSLIYSLVGIISLLGILKGSPINSDYFFLGILICLPIDFISFTLLYTNVTPVWIIVIIQIINFFIFWKVLTIIFIKKK